MVSYQGYHAGGELTASAPRSTTGNSGMSAVTPSPAVSHLGTLALFPREIRDEIYSLTMAEHGYHYFFTTPEHPLCLQEYAPYLKWQGGSFAILGLSSVIRQEALAVLSIRGIFKFDQYCARILTEAHRNGIPFVESISNLKISVNVDTPSRFFGGGLSVRVDPREAKEYLASKPAGPLSFFTGNNTIRNCCVIELIDCGFVSAWLLDSPLAKTISHLTGFKTVVLDFDCGGVYGWRKSEDMHNEDMDVEDSFKALAVKVSSAFEPNLGPATFGDVRHAQRPFKINREVTFHPQAHLASKQVQGVTPSLHSLTCD